MRATLMYGARDVRVEKAPARAYIEEENTAADGLELTSEQIAKLTALPPAAGDHHNEAQMKMIDR